MSIRPCASGKFVSATNSTTTCHGVDRNDLEALKSLCVQWEVDLSASIAEQNARIDRRKISRSQRQKEMGQLRDRIKRKMVAARL